MSRSFRETPRGRGACEVLDDPRCLTTKSSHPRRFRARLPAPARLNSRRLVRLVSRPILMARLRADLDRARPVGEIGVPDRYEDENGDGQHDTAHDLLALRQVHGPADSFPTARTRTGS